MPLCKTINMGAARILLWEITETEEQLAEVVLPADVLSASRFKNFRRRVEHLASRVALRCVVGESGIGYNAMGAPVLKDNGRVNISVSHTVGAAAVMVSPVRCAIDIERDDRNFEKVSARYLSEEELSLPGASDSGFAAAAWCAKEVLYKYSGQRELDLLKDIAIVHADMERGTFRGTIRRGTPVDITIILVMGCIIAWTAPGLTTLNKG